MNGELQKRIRALIRVTLERWALEREIEGLMHMTIDDFAPVHDACVTIDDPGQLSTRNVNDIIKALRANNR